MPVARPPATGGHKHARSRGGTVTPQSWARSFLASIGAPATPANVSSVVAWEAVEGGNWNNTATYNPINTTQQEPGSTSMNSVGVQAYPSWAEGLQATTTTIENGRYNDVLRALRSGKGLFGGTYPGLSTWSGGAYDSLSPHPGYAGGFGATIGGGTAVAGGAIGSADCLFPPSGSIALPVIPGVYSQSVNLPCLFTKSNARAFLGAGFLLGGFMVLALPGLAMLAASVGSKALGAAGPVLAKTGAAVALIPGAEAAGVAIAGAGRASASSAEATQRRRAKRRAERQTEPAAETTTETERS